MTNLNINKYSIGVACFRKRSIDDPYEILLVQKRVTYAFFDLIMGKYNARALSRIRFLIKNTTGEEQSELITKNFEILWWRATRTKKETNNTFYLMKESKFMNTFTKIHDIENLISQSSCILQQWEIPKGKHNSKRETDINCAVREFEEETNISPDLYQIIFDPISYSFQENNCTYNIKYYPAKCYNLPQLERINPNKKCQIFEIVDIRWMNINMVRVLGNNRLTKLVKRIFDKIK
jgi:8-oxo-dGTP pyrophosphatase MutT (NUDIX family)